MFSLLDVCLLCVSLACHLQQQQQQQQPPQQHQPFMFGGARFGGMLQMSGPQFPMLPMPGFASMALAGGAESEHESDQDAPMQHALVPAGALNRGGQAPSAAILQHVASQQAMITQLQDQLLSASANSSSSSSSARGGRHTSARRHHGLGGGLGSGFGF
jgi:hypothetical protein